jgi:hypothetical protein
MKYIVEIVLLLTWPLLIYVSYRLSLWAVNYFEENNTAG